MQTTSRTAQQSNRFILEVVEAVERFERNVGNLTRISEFGNDPLLVNANDYEQREILFRQNVQSGQEVFSSVVQGRSDLLRNCIVTFYDITLQLANRQT